MIGSKYPGQFIAMLSAVKRVSKARVWFLTTREKITVNKGANKCAAASMYMLNGRFFINIFYLVLKLMTMIGFCRFNNLKKNR